MEVRPSCACKTTSTYHFKHHTFGDDHLRSPSVVIGSIILTVVNCLPLTSLAFAEPLITRSYADSYLQQGFSPGYFLLPGILEIPVDRNGEIVVFGAGVRALGSP